MTNSKTTTNSIIFDEETIRENINFILSHFENQHELFPRTIMTFKTRGQRKIEYESDIQKSKEKIFEYFILKHGHVSMICVYFLISIQVTFFLNVTKIFLKKKGQIYIKAIVRGTCKG